MEKQFVRDLKEKDSVQSLFLAKHKTVLKGKNGKSYMSLVLGDSSGNVDARIWDNIEELDRLFQSGDIIRVKGTVQIFQSRLQVIVHKVESVSEDEYEIEQFVSKSLRDPEDMFQELMGVVEGLENSHIKQLIKDSLLDPQIKERFLRCPAAKTIHHAKIGGLLEHVLSIVKVMNLLVQHYTYLNRDLLIFGAIFHDLGKVWELEFDGEFSYTDEGRLVGHLVLASELVEKKSSRIMGFPDNLKNICKHIVLSHHGRLEYGSPKRPKILEALVVSMVDDLDSKLDTISSLLGEARQADSSWTRYSPLFDRYFYQDEYLKIAGDEI